jgi:hypothetical protein
MMMLYLQSLPVDARGALYDAPRVGELPIRFAPVRGYHHDPAVVVVKFEQPEHSTATVLYGVIYREGACSCADFMRRGTCLHVESWNNLVQEAGAEYLRGRAFPQIVAALEAAHGIEYDVAVQLTDEAISSLYDDAYGDISNYR